MIDKVGRFCLPIQSMNKNMSSLMQKSADFVRQSSNIELVLFSMIKSSNFWDIGHHGDCLQWEMIWWIYILVIFVYLFCLILHDVYFRSLDAGKNNASIILRSAFCCCVSVKLMISYKAANDKIGSESCFNDFIGQFSWATKPRWQKFANFIDRAVKYSVLCQ